MRKTADLALVFGLPLLSSLVAPPSAAQDGREAFSETVEVRVVNVEVVVEDQKGRRVTGLTPDRFRLFVDREEIPIEYFTEIRDGLAIDRQAENGPSRLPTLAPGEAVGNSYLVFIDDYFAIGAQRNNTLNALAKKLSTLGPGDQVAIVRFGGRRLELLTPWTRDLETVAQALALARSRPAYGLTRFTSRLGLGTALPSERSVFFPSEAEYELEREAAAVVSAMRGLSLPPGRKILLLLSGGWPVLEPGSVVLVNRWRSDLEVLRPVSETANLLGYTVYTLDVAGIRPPASVLRERPVSTDVRLGAGDAPIGEGAQAGAISRATMEGFSSNPLSRPETVLQTTPSESLRLSTLRVLADDTGGRALIGSLRASALPTIDNDSRSYYWLGFTPRRVRDDRTHSIRVRVAGERYEIRTRKGFRDLSRRAEASMATMGAALFASSVRENELEISLGAPRAVSRKKIEIDVRIAIPTDRIVFLPDPEGYVANLELRLAAVDDAGGQSEVPILPLRLRAASEPRSGDLQEYVTTLTLRRKHYDLAVSLFDPIGGRVLVAAAEIDL